MVRVLAPRDLMIPYLPHKIDGKLMFFLCRACPLNGTVQRRPCMHCDFERSWMNTYTSIDMHGVHKVGYKVLEYFELWHYPRGSDKFFKEFILNIVRRKIECSGFPSSCTSSEEKQEYVDELFMKSFVATTIDKIKSYPAGHYLNKIMANSVWGKWTQNPAGQQEIKTCSTIREYHNCLSSGRVKRVSLISDRLLQVEMKLDRKIDSENREKEDSRAGLGRKNPIIGAFVMAVSRDLMYFRYLSRLKFDQLLYMDTDSIIVYFDDDIEGHVQLPTSDLLGEIKDEYGDLISSNPTWYISELIAFDPKMYQLILRDKESGKVIKWAKMMKGISLKGNSDMFSNDKIPLYRNPVLDFCCILQYGLDLKYTSMREIWDAMQLLRMKLTGSANSSSISMAIILDQTIFKKEMMHIFMDLFITSQSIRKRVKVTQCKRFPKLDKSVPLGITYPIGWC